MRQYLFLFCVGIAISLGSSYAEEAIPSTRDDHAGYHIYGHAHNDYEHSRPLLDALDNKFYSVESDFWLVDGQLLVSHDKEDSIEDYKGTLKELYLDPLQKRVDEMGSVHGDGLPFYLWLDIKDGRDQMHPILRDIVKNYSMLSSFSRDKTELKPVTIILTGDHESKSSYVEKYEITKMCRDSNHYKMDDPDTDNQWLWYAINWRSMFDWRGDGAITQNEYDKLVMIVNDIHAKGRRVRFYSTPDMPSYWGLALKVGIDHINTDKLPELNAFLESQMK